ncbi:hypothetical protein AYO40_03615 [Planctomycetaceae bacterium SCGC AG-212-D15]|nr:hypothetical protein AYO40_03615 [Planctomycetaceae bacterium SCGC AG-212-D15]
MPNLRGAGSRVVSVHGAPAGSILSGAGMNNQGLRLRVLQEQRRGSDGPIQGSFVILEVGDNKHADALLPFLNRTTDAAEVLQALRARYSGCVSVANANILQVEAPSS